MWQTQHGYTGQNDTHPGEGSCNLGYQMNLHTGCREAKTQKTKPRNKQAFVGMVFMFKEYSVQFYKRVICQIPGNTTRVGFYIYLVCVCTCICADIVLQPMCRGQRAIFQGHFSPSTM